MSQLAPEILDLIFAAVRKLQLDRGALLLGIPSAFTASLKGMPDPASQLLSDIHALNEVVRLDDGSSPLRTWLENARRLSDLRVEQAAFTSALRLLASVAASEIAAAPPIDDPLQYWCQLVDDLAHADASSISHVEERIWTEGHQFRIQQTAFAFFGVPVVSSDPAAIVPLARLAMEYIGADSLPDTFSRGTARLLADLSDNEIRVVGRLIRWSLDHCLARRITIVALDREPSGGDVALWKDGPWRVLAFATEGKSLAEPDGVLRDMEHPVRLLSLMKVSGLASHSSFPGWWDIDPFRVEFDRDTLQRLVRLFEDPTQATTAPPSTHKSTERTGSASVGPVSISGGAIAGLSATVAGFAAGLRRCYSNGLKEDPTMRGSVRITARIGPNGEVLGASASGGSRLSGSVVACVQARVASSQFSPPEGGAATIEIPISFNTD